MGLFNFRHKEFKDVWLIHIFAFSARSAAEGFALFVQNLIKLWQMTAKRKLMNLIRMLKHYTVQRGQKKIRKCVQEKGRQWGAKKLLKTSISEGKKIRQTTQIEKRSIWEQSFLRLQLYAVISTGLESWSPIWCLQWKARGILNSVHRKQWPSILKPQTVQKTSCSITEQTRTYAVRELNFLLPQCGCIL